MVVEKSKIKVSEIRPQNTRLLTNGCCRLEFLLQNDLKIILPNHSRKTIHWFKFCEAFLFRNAICMGAWM